MRKFAALFAIVALSTMSVAVACDAEKTKSQVAGTAAAQKEVSLTGFLTDSYCGATNANKEGRKCALECVKKGATLQLYAGDKLYNLDKVESPESTVGYEVRVTGLLDEASNTIKVASIEQVKKG